MKQRLILFALLALFFLPLFTGSAMGAADRVNSQVPGYYRMKLGDFEITALYDGATELETGILHNTSPEEMSDLLAKMFVGNPKMETAVNSYLINTGSKLVLVDTGAGMLFGPSLGFVVKNLVASGYDPAQVDAVLITHLHPDHMGGLIDANGKPTFANATVFVSQADNNFWLAKKNGENVPEMLQQFLKMASDTAAPLIAAGRWQTFNEGEVVVPGITALKADGHTPGHTAYGVESNGQRLLIWGDLVHAYAIQFAKPGVSIDFDIDQQQAIATRKQIMADTSASSILVGGMHLPFPGLGHVRAEGNGSYAWVPVAFSPLPAQ